MLKRPLWIALTLSSLLLLPSAAMAQPDACWGTPEVIDEQIAACTEELTQLECTDFFDFEFLEGQSCAESDFNWVGACIVTVLDFGDVCFLVDPYLSTFDGFEACEFLGDFHLYPATYLGDGSTCGAVPTLPGAGRAILILVLLVGALVVLNLHGLIRSG